MNEPPGLPSALGIEAVEWLAQGAESLTVRVSGRWRRRRPTWSGQPLLVIEAGGSRHRYPAMPEPPSLTGAAPGTWQVSFSVPASVAGRAGARAWLQLGSVVVPLPVPIEHADTAPAADEETLSHRRVRAAELAAEAAARRAAEAQVEAEALRSEIDELEGELERLSALADDRRGAVRAAEQVAHAERSLREELEERLGEIDRAGKSAAESEHELRIAELEREIERLRGAVDAAEYVARTALAGRRRAEQQAERLAARERRSRLVTRPPGTEFEVAGAAVPVSLAGGREPPASPGDLHRLRWEQQLIESRGRQLPAAATLAALRRELEARTRSEARLRGALAALQADDRRHGDPDPVLRSTLAELRQELAHLRAALQAESEDRERAERRVARAYDAIAEVRDGLQRMRSGATERPPVESSGEVEAERLTAALERLREQTPEREDQDVSQPTLWLATALSSLARRDRAGASRVLGAMLAVSPSEARLAARLLAGGRVRRRLHRGAARFRGRGSVTGRLDQLVSEPVHMADLRIEPRAAMLLAAAMIDPAWTEGERFTIAYNSGPYLHVRGADRLLVSDAKLGAVAATVVCGPELLAAVLVGERPAGTMIVGDQRQLELVQDWLERAQSG